MEITIEQIKTFSPEIIQVINDLLAQLNPKSRTLKDEDLRGVIEGPSSRLLVARESVDNKIVGMLTLIISNAPSAKKGFLEDNVVDKDYQGKGVGRKLIDCAISQARKEGVERLEFTSNPKRVEANKFYNHLGFEKRDTNVYRIEL